MRDQPVVGWNEFHHGVAGLDDRADIEDAHAENGTVFGRYNVPPHGNILCCPQIVLGLVQLGTGLTPVVRHVLQPLISSLSHGRTALRNGGARALYLSGKITQRAVQRGLAALKLQHLAQPRQPL